MGLGMGGMDGWGIGGWGWGWGWGLGLVPRARNPFLPFLFFFPTGRARKVPTLQCLYFAVSLGFTHPYDPGRHETGDGKKLPRWNFLLVRWRLAGWLAWKRHSHSYRASLELAHSVGDDGKPARAREGTEKRGGKPHVLTHSSLLVCSLCWPSIANSLLDSLLASSLLASGGCCRGTGGSRCLAGGPAARGW